MPWFKVDDGLHAHMKAVRAGVPAMGLWVLAGSWSSNQLTDGWVPDYIVARLDPDYREHASTLVRAGLWLEDELDGDKGWRFHQWEEHQPSSESVLAKREAARERMRRVRGQRSTRSPEVRANVREQVGGDAAETLRAEGASPGTVDATPRNPRQIRPLSAESPASSRGVRANTRENFAGSAPNPDPTRPDLLPTEVVMGAKPASPSAPPTNRRGTRIPEDFAVTPEMRAWARENAASIDLAVETANFIDHWTAKAGQDAVKVKWVAAWQMWMRKAQQWSGNRSGTNRASGANRHINGRDDNPFRNGANATIASQQTGGHR